MCVTIKKFDKINVSGWLENSCTLNRYIVTLITGTTCCADQRQLAPV